MMPSPDTFPVPLIHINETNSTNNYLQSLCSEQKVEELTVVVADFQTSGRGQRGNSWESDPGKNLLFSSSTKIFRTNRKLKTLIYHFTLVTGNRRSGCGTGR